MTTSENPINYVLVKNSKVENIILVDNATDEFLEHARIINNADFIMPVPEKFLNPLHALSVGCTWDGETFILIQPFNSWILDDEKNWVAPVPRPDDGLYVWNEETVSWDLVPITDEPEDYDRAN